MADASSSSSSSSCLGGNHERVKYEVFISFGGYDVRYGFVSRLSDALRAKGIYTFVDNDLKRGEYITANLCGIIEESDLSVVIFSQNYPKSPLCLEELEKIHESMKQREHVVVPVFYEVDPSDVQDLKGNYGNIEEQKWRDALVVISNLSGFHSNTFGNDAKLIDAIVVYISMKLSEIYPSISDNDGLFGIDSSIKDVESLLCIDSTNEVRMVGIWGMGGIGKTTIAGKVFERNKRKFHGRCFVSNVRETWSKMNGQEKLRETIIHDLLQDRDIKIYLPFSIHDSILRRLKRIKVLIVLDDVHTCMQLKSLLKYCGLYSTDSFCPGSRIIVTSRDSQVLKEVKIKSDMYEAKQLKDDDALQLFSWHAFGQNNPQQAYEKLSKELIQYAHGVPLALIVLGGALKKQPTRYWEDSLKKFSTSSPLEIQEVLKISFDGLDQDEKNIFLDIACFLGGQNRVYLEHMLEACGFHASIGIDRLTDKSLLKEEGEKITMHDLLEQMGQQIVAVEKQSQQQQSRLWTIDDIRDVLTSDKGTKDVEAISLQCWGGDGEIDINPTAFFPMCKLRFLTIDCKVRCPMGLEFLPDSIRYLHWRFYPLDYWPPSKYNPEKLVVLHLLSSQLKELNWRNKAVKKLKRIDLSDSKNLVRISDLDMAPNLEVLCLTSCESLVEIGSSLEHLKKLTMLDLVGCRSLSQFPKLPFSILELKAEDSGIWQLTPTIGLLNRIKETRLLASRAESNICSFESGNFIQLPEDFGNLESSEEPFSSESDQQRKVPLSMQSLNSVAQLNLRVCESESVPHLPEIPCGIKELHLDGSGFRKLPASIGCLTHLQLLSLGSCERLGSLPSSIGNLKSLERLNLSKCRNLDKLPESSGKLSSLEVLDASYSGIRKLPSSIKDLKKLVVLNLVYCEKLESLPDLPSDLEALHAQNCTSLKKVPTRFIFPKHSLDLDSCPKLKEVASSIMEQYLSEAENCSNKMPNFCIAGSQVPEWMEYREDNGSALSLELDTADPYGSFIFCAVMPSNTAFTDGPERNAFPTAVVTHGGGQSPYYFSCNYSYEVVSMEEAPHVFLWNQNIDSEYIKQVSFECCHCSTNGKIIGCGVHPVVENQKKEKKRKN